jgi:hypothetical protein
MFRFRWQKAILRPEAVSAEVLAQLSNALHDVERPVR